MKIYQLMKLIKRLYYILFKQKRMSFKSKLESLKSQIDNIESDLELNEKGKLYSKEVKMLKSSLSISFTSIEDILQKMEHEKTMKFDEFNDKNEQG